jgi:CubicO group peptidase (beta-lactamase class C family)
VGVHLRGLNGQLRELELPRPEARGFCSGGGGLSSTPADCLRFLQALLNDGEIDGQRVLDTATARLMGENHTGDLVIPPMRSFDPISSADVDLFPDILTHWGLGFLINAQPVPGRRRAGSQTWAGLYNTHFWFDRESGIAGLLMTQLLPFCDPAFMAVYEAFERAAYDSFSAVTRVGEAQG